MNYKNILLMSVVLLSHMVNATSSNVEQDVASNRFCAPSGGKGLACIQDTICELTNKIDALVCCEDLCAATVITEAQILSESGIYCLGNDVTGTIIITGSSITLNLNGYVVLSGSDGIAVASTASDVRIRNGSVRGSGADRGIFINGATDVRIEDVTCENWEIGIYALDAFTVTFDHVMCNDNGTATIFENSVGAVVRNSTFNNNEFGALAVNGSIVEFINCSASGGTQISSDCSLRGQSVPALRVINRLKAKNMTRRASSNSLVGFLCDNATALYRDCSAFNFAVGFTSEFGQIDAFNAVAESCCIGFSPIGDRATLTNCIAENNFEAGFFSGTGLGEVIFRECVAKGNFGFGFFDDTLGTDNVSNMYLNCVACNNGTNYSPNIIAANNAPVTTAIAARGFDNIDCDLPEPATCAAKMVSEPQTLTEPGVYCLTNDIVGTIVIEGSGITLDLNGYTVIEQLLRATDSAIYVNDSDEVRIKNGRVEGGDNFNSSGIYVRDSYNVRIEDVTCEGWYRGIRAKYSSELVLDRVISSYNYDGVNCKEVTGLVIRDSIFDYNANSGVHVRRNSQGEILRCTGTGDNNFPITDLVTFGATTFHVHESQVILRECSATGYVIGFSAKGCRSSVDLYNCVAESNYEGFVLDGSRVNATNCASNNNAFSGFFMPVDCEGGFVTLRNCSTTGNSSFGFLDATLVGSVNMYLNCVACANGINYSPNIVLANNAPVTSAANARGFANVDCSDMTPDLLAAVIQLLLIP